ncbi:MAG: DUF805 domain-containing protein [Caulobacter sp.]|nr:DUF805 domain-containing protein [Caulobacter sp.]
MELMFQPLKKYADFQGRARRSEYWLFVLFQIIVYIIAAVLGAIAGGGDSGAVNLLVGVVSLGLLLPSLAVSVRRLHDIDRTGWWVLIGLIPLIGGIVLFIFSLLDGTAGRNRFGPDPKGRGDSNTAEVFE